MHERRNFNNENYQNYNNHDTDPSSKEQEVDVTNVNRARQIQEEHQRVIDANRGSSSTARSQSAEPPKNSLLSQLSDDRTPIRGMQFVITSYSIHYTKLYESAS